MSTDDQAPWCCPGRAAECPLCPQYGTRVDDSCRGHAASEESGQAVDAARLHAERRHPGYEYRTTEGPRKQWDDVDVPPADENGDPDASWERNVDAGRPGMGWDRFDYTEESYWRRLKRAPEQRMDTACAVLHTDKEGNVAPCPGYPHAKESQPEPPAEDGFALALREDDGTLIVGIHPDGQITTGPRYEPDAAAREFWAAVTRAAQAANPWETP